MSVILTLVKISCNKCDTSCRTYVSRELVDDWCERWAALPCPAHKEEAA